MNRTLFRPRTLDPYKRIPLVVDRPDDNNNDLTNPSSTQSSSSNSLVVSYSSTSNLQTSQNSTVSNSQLPQRCVPQMPFVSGMEREEEAEYHLQNALDAQKRLGSAKMCAVPIPDVYEDPESQSIYPATVELPKQLIRLQPLQLESDDPEYDMDKADRAWFMDCARSSCPNLTCLEYETIIDKLENASTRILISIEEAKLLLTSADESHLKFVYDFWQQRRTTRDKRLKLRLLTERDVKEEKGKHHPYVAFRRRVEKMTTRKNRKNDEQAYMSMLKLRSNFETVVKLTNLIKLREAAKSSWLEHGLSIFQARCEAKPDDEPTAATSSNSSVTLPTNHDRHSHHHARSLLKASLLTNSTSNLTASQQQQLLTHLLQLENPKKNQLSSSALTSLLQSPIKSQQTRSLSNDSNDSSQPKTKRFKGSDSSINNHLSKKLYRKLNHTDKLTQLLSSPTASSSSLVHNSTFPQSISTSPQSILERLSPGNLFSSPQQTQQSGRRRSRLNASGTVKQRKAHRNLPQSDLWSLTENMSGAAVLLKPQLESPKRLQQKEDLENNTNRRVILQDGSSVLSNSTENINNSVDMEGTSIDDEEMNDPWQFRPKIGCRYLRPIDQDQQQRFLPKRSPFAAFYYVTCSEQGHLGKRRVRLGRGGRVLYDRHIEQENNDLMEKVYFGSHFTDKPFVWRLSSRPALKESYRLHSHLTVQDHTRSLARDFHSKSSLNSIYLDDTCYHVNKYPDSASLHTAGKYRPSSTCIELDHSYSCSSRHVNQALCTLAEPQPPSPSSSPSPPLSLSSNNAVSIPQQMILMSTPPTPPPSSTNNNNEMDMSPQQQIDPQQLYTKSSSAFILSPSTPLFPTHANACTILSTSQQGSIPASNSSQTSGPSVPIQSSSPMSGKQASTSCGRVQLAQLHRIHAPTKPHKFASSTPVTTSDS